MSKEVPFVHCHVHTDHSLLDGCGRSIEYAEMAERMGMPAIAITDHGQLYGLPEHVEACKEHGIKPLVGCEWYVNDNRHDTEGEAVARKIKREAEAFDDPAFRNYHIVTIAADQDGWKNLLWLNHDSVRNGYYYRPRTTTEELCNHAQGMIATTACLGSPFNQAILRGDIKEAKRLLGMFRDAFGDRFYAELHMNELDEQRILNPELIRLCNDMGIPFILADDVHYACKGDCDRQDEAIAVSYGNAVGGDTFALEARHLYFSNWEQVLAKNEIFKAGIPTHILESAMRRTLEIADRCQVDIFPAEIHPPKYIDSQGQPVDDAFRMLQQMTHDGLKTMIESGVVPAAGFTIADYVQRAKYELKVIKDKGLADFYLVCWDAADYCNRNRIFQLVRGSGNSSLVACAIGLTQVDPLKWKLIFERFLDPDRAEPPDFDIDLSSNRRSEVLDYIIGKYGGEQGERCMQVIAIQNFKVRGAIRAVGKARGVDEMVLQNLTRTVNEYSKGLPVTWDTKLGDLVGRERQQAMDEMMNVWAGMDVGGVGTWIDSNRKTLEGILYHVGRAKNRSKHAAALALGPGPLVDYVPIDKVSGEYTTAWGEGQARQDLSKAGVMKLDLLGLVACDIVAECVELIKQTQNVDVWPKLNTLSISDDDPVMMAEFCTGAGYGLHEVNTGTQRIAGFMGVMQPRSLTDVVALLALYRPGAMEFCDSYVRRMRGEESVPQVHPIVDEELKDTYGIFVYQEQIMSIIHRLAGIPRRQAYTIIKAISKKKHKVIESARSDFISGAGRHGMDRSLANGIFDIICKWAEYGFNRAHSTGYALLAGVTAWLRGHYPIEFFASILNQTKNAKPTRSGDVREVDEIIRYAKKRGIEFLPLDVNKSQGRFTVENGKIRMGFWVVPGVSEEAGSAIASAAPFGNLVEFLSAIDQTRKVNVKVVRAISRAGALDSLGGTGKRALLYDVIECWSEAKSTKKKTRTQRMREMLADDTDQWVKTGHLSDNRLAIDERDTLGFNVSYEPFAINGRREKIEVLYERMHASPFSSGDPGGVIGQVQGIKKKKDKRGNEMADATIVTPEYQQVKVVIFASLWNRKDFQSSIKEGGLYLFRGKRQRLRGSMLLGMDLPRGHKPLLPIDSLELKVG